jgi:hypothetical protein
MPVAITLILLLLPPCLLVVASLLTVVVPSVILGAPSPFPLRVEALRFWSRSGLLALEARSLRLPIRPSWHFLVGRVLVLRLLSRTPLLSLRFVSGKRLLGSPHVSVHAVDALLPVFLLLWWGTGCW